jgi:hypothetical protein
MKPRELFDLQYKLGSLAENARDISLLLLKSRPDLAAKMQRLAMFASNLESFIRTHDEIPPAPKEPAKVITLQHSIVKRLPKG